MSIRVYDPGGHGGRTYYSTDQYLEFAERATIFDGVIASTISDVVWTGRGDPQRLRGNHCTTNTFDVMGVPPLVGRAVQVLDGAPGAAPVAVLGFRFWQRQFGGDPSVVGRQLVLNGVSRTVVGVMPKRFMWRGADVYVPIVLERGQVVEGVRDVHVLGRLKAGVTEAQAEADLRPIVADLATSRPGAVSRRTVARWADVVQGDVPQRSRRDAVDPLRRRGAAAAHRLRQRVEPASRRAPPRGSARWRFVPPSAPAARG